jgi:hypothetical protein
MSASNKAKRNHQTLLNEVPEMEFCPCYRTRLSEQEGKEQMQTRSAGEDATGCFRCTEWVTPSESTPTKSVKNSISQIETGPEIR